MPTTLHIIDLENDTDMQMTVRKRSGYSGTNIGKNIRGEISPYYYQGGNKGVSSYSYGGNMNGYKAPYYYEGGYKGVSPYSYEGGKKGGVSAHNYKCGNQGVTPYSYGGNIQGGMAPYYYEGGNKGVSPYSYEGGIKGVAPYNYYEGNRGISHSNYQCGNQTVSPYYYEGGNKGVSPYNYSGGNKGISPYSYECGYKGVSPYYYEGGNKGVAPYHYDGGNKGISSYNYQCGSQAVSPYYYGGGNKGVSSYYYEGGNKGVAPYHYDGGNKGISPYNNYQCGSQAVSPYYYGDGNKGVAPYHYDGGNKGISPYNNYQCGSQAVSPYYYGDGNKGVAPYHYNEGNKGISPYNNYQCGSQAVSPYYYEGGNKGVLPYSYECGSQAVSPYYYQGGEQGISEMKLKPDECPPRITRLQCKRKCCRKTMKPDQDFAISPMSAEGLSGLGPLAKKYISKNKTDFVFGLHFDKESNAFKVGHVLARVEGDDIVVNYDDEVMKYIGTEGLWRLITQDLSYFDEEHYFTDEDWVVYMEMLLRTNYHQCIDTVTDENVNNKDKEIAPMFLCCLGVGYAFGAAAGGTAGLAAGGAGGLAVGGAGGLAVGGVVGGGIGFAGGVAFTLSLLGLKFAAPLAKKLTDALYAVLSKKANFIKEAGGLLYGKIGQLKDKIYYSLGNLVPSFLGGLKDRFTDVLGKLVPKLPGGFPDSRYLKFWDWFKCPTCCCCRELDELLRLLISLQKPETSPNKQCGFTQNCILFWIVERIVACFGKGGGCERLIDWVKINIPLINLSDLLKQLIDNLPWGYHCKDNPICGPQTEPAEKDKECSTQGGRYKWYFDLSLKLELDVKIGMEVLEELLSLDPDFFKKLEGFLNLSCEDLNNAFKRVLEFLKSYFEECPK